MSIGLRRAVAAFIAALALVYAVRAVGAAPDAYVYTERDVGRALTEAAQRHGVSRAFLRCIAFYETGGTFDPYAIGDDGRSHGAFQLYEHGLLPTFYAWGYTTPYSPYQAADFVAAWGKRNGWQAWTPVRWGLC